MLLVVALLGSHYSLASNGVVNRAAPEILGVVETFVSAAPVEQVLGQPSKETEPSGFHLYFGVTKLLG